MQPRRSAPQYIVQGAGVSTPYAPTIIMDWQVRINGLIKAYVPRQQQRSVRIAINDIKRRVLSLGWSVECPICAGTFGQFCASVTGVTNGALNAVHWAVIGN